MPGTTADTTLGSRTLLPATSIETCPKSHKASALSRQASPMAGDGCDGSSKVGRFQYVRSPGTNGFLPGPTPRLAMSRPCHGSTKIIMSIRPTPRNPTLPCRDGGVLHRCNPCEIGGRWNDESLRLVAQLVRSRALRAPAPLRGAATQGWYRRWWGLLSVAVQNAKHTCCHFARVAARPCPYAWRAGTASAGRPARRVPARAQLPAGSLSRCSPSAVP